MPTPSLPSPPYMYRTGNPTRGAFERALAVVEHGKHAVAFASGIAATSALIHLLQSGDHVIVVDDVYGGTQRYFRRICAPTYNIQFTFVDFNDKAALEGAFRLETKMLWLETPTNPTLKVRRGSERRPDDDGIAARLLY